MTPFRLLLIALLSAPVAAQVIDKGYASHRHDSPANSASHESKFNSQMEPGLRLVSDDGRYCVFTSLATNLVAGQQDMLGTIDAFWHDRHTGQTRLMSRSAGTLQSLGGASVSISADGMYASFVSAGKTLMPNQQDTNNVADVFLYDAALDTVTLVTHTAGNVLTAANNAAIWPAISANGRYVAYATLATDMAAGVTDNNGTYDLYVYDRLSGSNTLISHVAGDPATTASGWSGRPLLSDDGQRISFASKATNLVAGQVDSNGDWDAFHYNRATGECFIMSLTVSGPTLTTANAASYPMDISGDGRYTLLLSEADDMGPGITDTNGELDLFVYDAQLNTTRMLTVSAANPTQSMTVAASSAPSINHVGISRNGEWVVFSARDCDVMPGLNDNNDFDDVFLLELNTGAVQLVSRRTGGWMGNGDSTICQLSADGQYVMFLSAATNLVYPVSDGNAGLDAFRLNRASGVIQLLSGPDPSTAGAGVTTQAYISADGTTVYFVNNSQNILGGDFNGATDVFWAANSTVARMQVLRSGKAVGHNSIDQAPPTPASGVTWQYTIRNVGGVALNLTGNPRVELSYVTDCTATITQQPAALVDSLQSTTFDIHVVPSGESTWAVSITVWSDQDGPNPCTWTLRGSTPGQGGGGGGGGGGSEGSGCAAGAAATPLPLIGLLLWRRRRNH
ncbi:MAG: hypothetical protein KF696_08470 [Planctomycetes bacterium]|nr:hypothetical protein [Planctomycetota bacterium]MCW8135615.1 hypothetical protein [Planctomycetota bacterium]